MISWFSEEGTAQALEDGIKTVSENKEINTICVFMAPAGELNHESCSNFLSSVKTPIIGGIFPAILFEKNKYDTGVLVIGLKATSTVKTFEHLSLNEEFFEDELDANFPAPSSFKTILVFVDGFAKKIDKFIQAMFNVFGLEINYVGGGAGTLDMLQKPCLITNNGILHDSAVLALIDINSSVGVNHGWISIQGPFKITESEGTILHTIDWEPAFDIYKNVINTHSGLKITRDNFFSIAKSYPFGIAKLGSERIVRDPFQVVDTSSLQCVGEMPEGAFIDILNADMESLISAATNAMKTSRDGLKSIDGECSCLFIDCISRVLFLGDDFYREIEAVYQEGIPLFGACTIGEIANCGFDFLEFYNKTVVVAHLEESCKKIS